MSKRNQKNSAPVTTMVPNENGELEVVEVVEPTPGVTEDGELSVTTPPKAKKGRGKRELDENDPFNRQIITLLRAENPKRKGSKSAARFELYRVGMTVAEFIKAGGTRGDINWDVAHEHIKLEAAAK